MATSPIYNWPEPDNTDLVKNGALAIRTLGDAIDTTMATMVPKTIVDAKGDLIAATANDTPARLAVGANNTVLTADSSTSTGLKWATPATSSSGLTQIGSKVTFTAASAVNVNSCFSSTYNRYFVLLKIISATGSARCYVKLRGSGTDVSSGYYYSILDSVFSGAAPTNTAGNNLTTGWPTILPTASYTCGGAFTFYSPFEATHTIMTQSSFSVDSGGLTTQGGGVQITASSYDGFSLVFASGTYTGELVVYGYSN